MSGDGPTYWIPPTLGATTFPVQEILTGRGAIFGKSGSGKSNTTSVIVEQLIENGYSLMIVDQEGEYIGLKEAFDVLHVGKGNDCDIEPTISDAGDIVDISLTDNTPVLLDVSEYLDTEFARELVAEVLSSLFHAEKEVQKPYLVVLEEAHEFLPQSGGGDEVSEIIERLAKRGRKRGIGLLGISQRPSSVDKDFVTQCDWLVWHRLTWKNDVRVVNDILGNSYATKIEDLDTGEAFLLMDWEDEIEQVTFKQKRTEDIGATPGLENYKDIQTGSNSESDHLDHSSSSSPIESLPDSDTGKPDTTQETDPIQTPSTNGHSAGDIDLFNRDTLLQYPVAEHDIHSATTADIVKDLNLLHQRNQVLIQHFEKNTGSSESLNVTSDGLTGEDPLGGRDADNPAKPKPPSPPEPKSGVAGNMVEFAQLVVYMIKLLFYKIRIRISS